MGQPDYDRIAELERDTGISQQMSPAESIDRAAAIQAEKYAAEDAQKPSEEESFDAFWADITAAEKRQTEVIRGVEVYVPTPRQKTMKLSQQIATFSPRSVSEQELHQLIADIFGVDVLGKWVDADMTEEQFGVVIAWALSRLAGRDITWRQAYEAVVEGKAPPPKNGNKHGSSPPSGGTGGRSKGSSRKKGGRRKK